MTLVPTSGILKIVISCCNVRRYYANRNGAKYLLLEVPPVLLVDEYKVQVIPNAELLVHFSERRSQVKAA